MTDTSAASELNLAAILNALGDLKQDVGGLMSDVSHAEASRKVIHNKLDAQSAIQSETIKTLAEVQFALKVTTDVAVQARDGLKAFEAEFHETQAPAIDAATAATEAAAAWQKNAEPLLDNVRWVKRALIAIAALLALGGVSVGVVFANANWIIKTAVKAWLELPVP